MLEGAFSFLLLIFSSPQQVITNQLEGYWIVTIDSTNQARNWNRIYYFEDCPTIKRKSLDCEGHYGWAEFDGVYQNLYDKNYLSYGAEEDKEADSKGRKLLLSSVYYDFLLNAHKKTLKLYDPESKALIMEMRKVPDREVRKSN